MALPSKLIVEIELSSDMMLMPAEIQADVKSALGTLATQMEHIIPMRGCSGKVKGSNGTVIGSWKYA